MKIIPNIKVDELEVEEEKNELYSLVSDIISEIIDSRKEELRGDQGIQGEKGLPGMNGNSVKGEKGDRGLQGVGERGERGFTGEKGDPGKDGHNPDPLEVIEAIKNLKGNDRLDISHLRNGEQLLSGLGKRGSKYKLGDMRWHGAGTTSGSGTLSVVTKIQNYTLTTADDVVKVDATLGNLTMTLPDAATVTKKFTIKKVDSSSNTVTVNTTSLQTIDGQLTQILSFQWNSFDMVSDGSNYFVL